MCRLPSLLPTGPHNWAAGIMPPPQSNMPIKGNALKTSFQHLEIDFFPNKSYVTSMQMEPHARCNRFLVKHHSKPNTGRPIKNISSSSNPIKPTYKRKSNSAPALKSWYGIICISKHSKTHEPYQAKRLHAICVKLEQRWAIPTPESESEPELAPNFTHLKPESESKSTFYPYGPAQSGVSKRSTVALLCYFLPRLCYFSFLVKGTDLCYC